MSKFWSWYDQKNILLFKMNLFTFAHLPRWRNWQTHHFEGVAGNHTSSTLVLGTKKKVKFRMQNAELVNA